MMCQKCKVREATVTITKLVQNMQITMQLCPECSKSFTHEIHKQISGVNNLLMNLAGTSELLEQGTDENGMVCHQCDMSFADFRKNGMVGCEECYQTFRDRFASILKKLHGNYRHVGLSYEEMKKDTLPRTESTENKGVQAKENKNENVAEQIKNLKKALEEAVAREEYEEAAKIRDMIRIMEDESAGGNVE
ncbi:MAG: UvrB/UvrC motif-containing protein [Clostridia bacterium]|jgi:protein arginine kinase activator